MAKQKIVYFYKLHTSMKLFDCFYCGAYGESKDHVPPISYPDTVEEEDRLIVRACLLCNCLLGNKPFFSLLTRCEYLLRKYQSRFRKNLEMPWWTETEINELTGILKRKIILSIKTKKYIEAKLIFIQKNINILQGYDS